MKKIKNYIIDMISDTSGHINSKIVMGIVSFFVAVALAFMEYPTQYPIMFLSFSAGCFGFSCFDNNSAFKFQKTETNTVTKDIEIKADAEQIVDKITKVVKKKK